MNSLAGTGTLLRLALRRDRIMLPAWVYVLTAAAVSTAYSFGRLYATAAAREQFAAGMNTNSSLRALYGPVYDASLGGLTAWRMGAFGALLAGLMSILLVVRHTRAEEEDGRLELVGAGAVGRRAPLTAALLAALSANLLLAVLVTAGLAVLGQPLGGAAAFGSALAACGLVFAGVAAVTAQVAETGRAANGAAGAVLGAAFVLRAAGDSAADSANSTTGRLSWLSPIGWAEQVRPFASDRWWVVALGLLTACLLAAAAYVLVGHRDLGAGLLPQRPGPANAAPALRTHLALAWRLQRGTLYGWCAAFAVAGAVFGGVAGGVASLIGDNRQVSDILRRIGGQQAISDAYLATILGLLGMVAAVYAVQSVQRLRGEELGGRAEPVLATAVSRTAWAGGHLLFPLLGSAALLTIGGLTAGLTSGASLGNLPGHLGSLLGGALVQLPAVWLAAGVTLALLGLRPRWTSAGWGVLAAFLVIGWLGPVLRFGRPILDLSPFTHLPHLPGGAFDLQPLLWLTALAAALAVSGLAALRRRDLD
ncbi:ABC transporter permease [Kitasatospora sp. GP82]|uniref:ABC transporter permease n=1 Tax=Kitasatospora sp. GP82 TaxID=3035089 RepID=UPI0024748EDA|nr:ABC transporter permease [Kitasatospora sp. GP82]MDH6125664.1 ABC-2 type transport system permease protein [Kitasatospora sp. GP82]